MIERVDEFAFPYPLHDGHGEISIEWHGFDHLRLPVAVQTWRLPPGVSEGMHVHDVATEALEELYLVLGGTGRMHVDHEIYDVGPGDCVLAPSGTRHDLANTGDDELRVLVVWGRPGEADWSAYGSAARAREQRNG